MSEEFEGKFECLEENVEKYITFSVSIDKKNWKWYDNNMQNLTNNLTQGLHKSEFKDFKSCLEYANVEDGLVVSQFVDCNKDYEKEGKRSRRSLAKRFGNTKKFCQST